MWVQNGNQNDVHPGLGAVAAGAEVHSLSLLLHKLAPSFSSLLLNISNNLFVQC